MMKHTELIGFILEELSKAGRDLHGLENIHKTFLPDIEYTSAYSSNWSNWVGGRTGNINNREVKEGIAKTLGFDGYIWNADTSTQRTVIREAVQRFVHPVPVVDLSELLPHNTPLSKEQEEMLNAIRYQGNSQIREMLDAHPFLKPLPENQIFLLKLLPLLFARGMYTYLIDTVIPALLPHNAEHTQVKIFHAHTYGSLPRPEYLKAVSLLSTIDIGSDALALEVMTGMVSNLRRHTMEDSDITKEQLLEALPAFVLHYSEIFEKIERHHYYPGINLAYMLTLSMYMSPNDPKIADDEIAGIYRDAMSSITQNSHSSSEETLYYAKMSEIEFHLLLGKHDAENLLGHLLELDTPSPAYVERTLRMMQFFVRMLERFSEVDASGLIERFQMVIGIMDIYIVENR